MDINITPNLCSIFGGSFWDKRPTEKAGLSTEIQPIIGRRNGFIFTYVRVWSRKFVKGATTCRGW
ncbi:hypothetical protein [Thermococcus chitonophagus]|nr:hypothetical protein [Thermococcus chitonophagus]